MKLEGEYLRQIESAMSAIQKFKKRDKGIENEPLEIQLKMSEGAYAETDADYVRNAYQATVLSDMPLIRMLAVEVPRRNLRRLVEDDRVEKYDWPRHVEF